MKKTSLMILAFLLIVSAVTFGCSQNPNGGDAQGKNVVKIAYLPITHALPLFELKEELQAENGDLQVELVQYGSWPELLDALNTNRVDGASVLIELAMKAKQSGVGIKAVALGHKDGNVMIASNDIQTAADLKGKRISIPHRQSSHNILVNHALEQGGLTIDDVTIVELAPPEMPAALANKQIDAYCVAEPFGAVAVSIGAGRVLFTSEELWEDSLCCGLALTDSFIGKRHEVASELVRRYHEAGKRLDKERAKEIAVKYLKQSEDVLELSLQWISYDDLKITPEIYQGLRDRVVKFGLSDQPPTYEAFVDNEL